MVNRLLAALDYPEQSININDENKFKDVIAWLEEHKIQRCKVNQLNDLKNVRSNNWYNFYNQYKNMLGCPKLENKTEELQWILGYAVQLETNWKRDVYLKHAVEHLKITNVPSVVTENPLDNLDFNSQEFKDGITHVAKLLNIQPHPDHLMTLKAVSRFITKRLNKQVLEKPTDYILEGKPFPWNEADLGFDLKDPVMNQAAKVLRLLYIHDLRSLQTKANELIVAVQTVTANPKTDTKLGKVGR